MKSLETFHKRPTQYSLLKKLSLELAPIMLVLFQSLQDFTYIAFKGLVCINCVHSESHHIASKSFETFHTPPNDEVLMIKLSLCHCSFSFYSWPVVLRSTTFFYVPEFLKFWLAQSFSRCWKNFSKVLQDSPNRLKLSTVDLYFFIEDKLLSFMCLNFCANFEDFYVMSFKGNSLESFHQMTASIFVVEKNLVWSWHQSC